MIVQDLTATVYTLEAPDGIRSVTLTGDTAYCTCMQRCCGHVDMARVERARLAASWRRPENVTVLEPMTMAEYIEARA